MNNLNNKTSLDQLTTFYIGKELFGVEVLKVQEVASHPQIVKVPLAPNFVKGLINLRGQIATAIGLREIFEHDIKDESEEKMSVVCKLDGNLVSLIVDSVGDVVEVDQKHFESVPETLRPALRKYLKGIYKMDGALLNVLNLDSLAKELSPTLERSI